MTFEIVSDTSHDLKEEFTSKYNISSVPFYIRLDSDEYLKEGIDINRKELYKRLRADSNLYPKTSLPSVEDYKSVFESILEEGKDVLCFTVASKLSGSYQSAKVAADMAGENYPGRKIYVIDSRSASLGNGILVENAAIMRERGLDIEEIKDKLEEQALTSDVTILLDTLTYLEKGGRLSKTKAAAGNLLKIKPIASFKENTLILEKLVRGRKRSINYGLELLDERIKDNPEGYEVFVIHGDDQELANEIKTIIQDKYGIKIKYEPPLVSAAVISHLGPGTIGIGSIKRIKNNSH